MYFNMWFLFLILTCVSSELIDLDSKPSLGTKKISTVLYDDVPLEFLVPPEGCVYSLITYKSDKPLLPSTTFVACPSDHPCKTLCNTAYSGTSLYNNPFQSPCRHDKEVNITLHRSPGATCAPVCFGEGGVCPLDPLTGERGVCQLTDVSTGMKVCALPCDTDDDCRSFGGEHRSCYNKVCLWDD